MLKFQQFQVRQKNEVCLQGTYTAQNFIVKTPIVLYSITKEISEVHHLERE